MRWLFIWEIRGEVSKEVYFRSVNRVKGNYRDGVISGVGNSGIRLFFLGLKG